MLKTKLKQSLVIMEKFKYYFLIIFICLSTLTFLSFSKAEELFDQFSNQVLAEAGNAGNLPAFFESNSVNVEQKIQETESESSTQEQQVIAGYWKFDEGSGTIAYDSSPYHNNGQLYNATWVTDVDGYVLYFSGADNSYVEVPNKPELNPVNRLVIEARVKPTGYPAWYTAIVQKADSNQTGCFGERSYSLWATNDGRIHFTFTPDGENCQHNYFTQSNLIPNNQWSQVKVDLNTEEGKVRIFVNGNKVLEEDCSRKPIRDSNLPLRIGGMFRSGGDQSNFQGDIDEVKISTFPENLPPTTSNFRQFKSDGVTSIVEGGATTESTIIFKAILNDSDNDQVKLQIEIKEKDQPFSEQDLLENDFVSSGAEVALTGYGLVNGQYKWRARAIDNQGNISNWQEFGETGNVDFVIDIRILPDKAVELTKEVIGAPYLGDGIEWGGKGYDCSEWPQWRFVSSEEIKTTGYDYWHNKLEKCIKGKGID